MFRVPFHPKPHALSRAIALALITTQGAFAAEFVVQTNSDTGGGTATLVSGSTYTIDTLRSAIEAAESGLFPNADSISFAPALTQGGPVTIPLATVGDTFAILAFASNSAFGINTDITIQGSGNAADIVLQANALRHFQINNMGVLRLDSLTLTSGSTPDDNSGLGGAVLVDNSGDLTLSNSVISGNIANTGGALNVRPGATALARNSVFLGNATTGVLGSGNGGAINARGATQIIDCIISQNTANLSGGGVFTTGVITITGSTLSNNTAVSDGGGLAGNNYGEISLVNSTISGNKSASRGGGIFAEGISLRVTNSTVVLNSARETLVKGGGPYVPTADGGGIFDLGAGAIILHNTLVAGNTVANGSVQNDLAAQVATTSKNNLIGVDTAFIGISDGVNGNQIGTLTMPIDPLLGLLTDNGGPSPTHALSAGSPARDTGNNAQCQASDQRGQLRFDGACDIGAFEFQELVFADGFEAP